VVGSPQLLFLDEPTTGLDPSAIREFYTVLDELRAQGVTLVITSHILAELQGRVDRLAIMANGRIVAQGSVQDLREQTHMPLTIELRAQAAPLLALRADLARIPGLLIQDGDGCLRISCPRETKMVALAALAPHATALQDLQIQEPSLEDMFFGLKGTA
jgi:Cu-processing system ATP-binding protein